MSASTLNASKRISSAVIETLEKRAMLCDAHLLATLPPAPEWSEQIEAEAQQQVSGGPEATVIDWTNRGLASDGFANTFGTSAELMRNIVDAALFSWQRVITNWNRADGTTSLQVSITVQAPGTNFGGSGGPGAAPADGKPRTGSVSLGGGFNTPDPNDVNGWFADPDPYDNAEFMGQLINAYTSETTTGGLDFFSLVTIELAHVLGIISDEGNAGGGYENYRLEDFVTNTGVPDIAQGGGNGTYRVFNGATIDHVMTSYNSGSGGVNSWGNVVHTAGPTANVTFGGNNYRGSVDPGNALYGPQRYLPSFAAAHILRDAYGYSIAEPMTFGTFHAVIDDTTGRLTVRGGGGVSNDNINISFINGNTIRVSVDVGSDVPGTGALPGVGNLPAFVTDFPAISVSEIYVDAGSGNDAINIESLPFFADATVQGGQGDDLIQLSPSAANLDTIAAPVQLDGGSGSDRIILADYNSPNSHAYTVNGNVFTRPGAGALNVSSEVREVYGADGNNSFNIIATQPGTLWKLAGHLGNDTFNVGQLGGSSEGVDGDVELYGEEGADTINYSDATAFSDPDYTFQSNQILRSGNAPVTYFTIETIQLTATSDGNTITLGAPPSAPIPMLHLNGSSGNDVFVVNLSDTNAGFGGNLNGNDGTDTVAVIDSRSTISISIHAGSFLGNFGASVRQHNYNVDALTYTGGAGNDNFDINSTAANTIYTFNGGGGNDAFVLGHNLGNPLDGLGGRVTINGDAGTDNVLFDDQQQAVGGNYSFHTNLVTSGGTMADVSYTTIEVARYFGGSGNDNVTVHSTSAATPLTLAGFIGSDTVDVLDNAPGSPVVIDGGPFGFERVNVNTDGTGAASVLFDFSATLTELNIFNGGTATLSAGAAKVIETDALTIAATGRLDLNDNDLIVDYAAASQLPAIQALINSARAGGAWTGAGITSTSARNASPQNKTLGAIEASTFKTLYGNSALFAGRSIDTTAVLVKFTYYGDTDFNGKVDGADYARIDAKFNQQVSQGNIGGWFNGDTDGNGKIDGADYALIDAAFNSQGLPLRPAGPAQSTTRIPWSIK